MFHLYLTVSCVSSWTFPAALRVLVFYVPVVTLSLPRILDGAPVACLAPPSWCTVEGAVLVDPGGDRFSMVWLFFVMSWFLKGKVQPDKALSLQVEHVAVEFVAEPFCPSGHSLGTMKTSALSRRVDTSYFTAGESYSFPYRFSSGKVLWTCMGREG